MTHCMGGRNTLISIKAPCLRVRECIHFLYCLGFSSFAESVHKGPAYRFLGDTNTFMWGTSVGPSKFCSYLWCSRSAASGKSIRSVPELQGMRHTGVKGSLNYFLKPAISYAIQSVHCCVATLWF